MTLYDISVGDFQSMSIQNFVFIRCKQPLVKWYQLKNWEVLICIVGMTLIMWLSVNFPLRTDHNLSVFFNIIHMLVLKNGGPSIVSKLLETYQMNC